MASNQSDQTAQPDAANVAATGESGEAIQPEAATAAASAPVTVNFMSGEAVELAAAPEETVRGLVRLLEEKRPLHEGTKYRLSAGGAPLEPGAAAPKESLLAVVVKLTLLEQVAGSWRRELGDYYFTGLKIEEDGAYQCNAGSVRDGLVRIVSEEERKINLRRTIADANDHIFEVSANGQTMTGHCPQSGIRWTLTKAD